MKPMPSMVIWNPAIRPSTQPTKPTVYHVSDVDRRGARAVAEEAVAIASDGTDGVYFSFDVDSLDSSVCTGTCVPTRDLPRYVSLYRIGRLPVNRLMSGRLTIDQINEGFDLLHEGKAIRQVVVFP